VIVQYCDVAVHWDFEDFLHHTRSRDADGALVTHCHFHPHMLGTTNYAFMKDDGNQWMLEIREKEPYTDNRMNEHASAGTHYFKTGTMMKKYFRELIYKGLDKNGEYYVSCVFNLLQQDSLNVSIYEIQHMLHWGTPYDVMSYIKWSKYFRRICKHTIPEQVLKGTLLVPLAGRGGRFKGHYDLPKPLIDVNGYPMVVQSANSLPHFERQVFVCLKEHLDEYPLAEQILNQNKDAEIVELPDITEGQACTCAEGVKNANVPLDEPLLVGCCDSTSLYDQDRFLELTEQADVVVPPGRGDAPQAVGLLDE